METGRRRDDETGQLIPAHFITELRLLHNGELVVAGNLSTAVSRNPYFTFELSKAQLGDVIRVHWKDNLGLHDEEELRIKKND
jgi:sulfur-oxidizing protein SoxZ